MCANVILFIYHCIYYYLFKFYLKQKFVFLLIICFIYKKKERNNRLVNVRPFDSFDYPFDSLADKSIHVLAYD